MTQSPESGRLPELTPGEPLWGNPGITASPAPDAAASRGGPEGERRQRVAGSARPVKPPPASPPPPPPPAPVRFGTMPTAGPTAGPEVRAPYGHGTTYGGRSGGGAEGRPAAGRTSRTVLVVTAVVSFLLGAAVGFGASWILT